MRTVLINLRQQLQSLVKGKPIRFREAIDFLENFEEKIDDVFEADKAAFDLGWLPEDTELSDIVESLLHATYQRYGRHIAKEFLPLIENGFSQKAEDYCCDLSIWLDKRDDTADEISESLEGSHHRIFYELAAKYVGHLDDMVEEVEEDEDYEPDEEDLEEQRQLEEHKKKADLLYKLLARYFHAYEQNKYNECLDICDEIYSLDDDEQEFSSYIEDVCLPICTSITVIKDVTDYCRIPVYREMFFAESTLFFSSIRNRDMATANKVLDNWHVFSKDTKDDEEEVFAVDLLDDFIPCDDVEQAVTWGRAFLKGVQNPPAGTERLWTKLIEETLQLLKMRKELHEVFEDSSGFQQMINLSRRMLLQLSRWYHIFDLDEPTDEEEKMVEIWELVLDEDTSSWESWAEELSEQLYRESAFYLLRNPLSMSRLFRDWADFLKAHSVVVEFLEYAISEDELIKQLNGMANRSA